MTPTPGTPFHLHHPTRVAVAYVHEVLASVDNDYLGLLWLVVDDAGEERWIRFEPTRALWTVG